MGVHGGGSRRAAAARSPQHLAGAPGPCSEPARVLCGLCGGATALHTPWGAAGMAVRKGSTPGCPLPCRGCHRAGLPPPGGSRGPFLHLVATNPFSHLGSYPIAFSPRLTAPLSDPRGSPSRFPCLERIPCSAGTPARPPLPRSRGRFLPRGPSLLEQHRARRGQAFGVPPDAGAVSPAWSGGGCGLGTPR